MSRHYRARSTTPSVLHSEPQIPPHQPTQPSHTSQVPFDSQQSVSQVSSANYAGARLGSYMPAPVESFEVRRPTTLAEVGLLSQYSPSQGIHPTSVVSSSTFPPSIQPVETQTRLLQSSAYVETCPRPQPKKNSVSSSESDGSHSLSVLSSESDDDDLSNLFKKDAKKKGEASAEDSSSKKNIKRLKKKANKLVSCCLIPLLALGILKRVAESLI